MFKKNNFVYQNKISEEFFIKGIVYSVNGQWHVQLLAAGVLRYEWRCYYSNSTGVDACLTLLNIPCL